MTSEAAFQRAVLDLAGYLGWLRHHDLPSQRADGRWTTLISGDPGYPDLTLAHPEQHRILFLELKSKKGRTTMNQDDWLSALRGVPGLEVYVWRPQDWPTIERILKKPPVSVEESEVAGWPV